jgi:hypothetical protein
MEAQPEINKATSTMSDHRELLNWFVIADLPEGDGALRVIDLARAVRSVATVKHGYLEISAFCGEPFIR